LAPTLGLWVRRPPLTSHIHVVAKALLSLALWPVIWLLLKMDKPPERFEESTMTVGFSASAHRPE
jgi:cell shape-determining protein MreD